jgi:two-component system OmpR family response regulator
MSDTNTPKRIVIIDDDTFLLDMYVTKFKKNGFEVLAYSSAQEALDRLKEEQKLDAVIFDIIMPGMDGWTFAREYRKQNLHPTAKFIVLSNQNQQTDIEISKEVKTDMFIVKALKTPSEVVQEINSIL